MTTEGASASTPSHLTSSWIVRHRPIQRLRQRLFCFPYAGGGAGAYRGWEERVPLDVEVVLVQPPGRELRLLEPAFRDMGGLIESLLPRIHRLLDVPFFLFGHSMGAFVAFELAHALRRKGHAGPQHLFVSSSRAPHVPDEEPPIHGLDDCAFIEMLRRRYDGIPEEVLSSPELMELLLPNLKADLELVETYAPPAPQILPCPISCFGGLSDRHVTADDLRRWGELTEASFQLRCFEGDHFYLTSHRAELLDALGQVLRGQAGNPG